MSTVYVEARPKGRPEIARVRHLNDKKKPDPWRPA
jgi:hypothetical protein